MEEELNQSLIDELREQIRKEILAEMGKEKRVQSGVYSERVFRKYEAQLKELFPENHYTVFTHIRSVTTHILGEYQLQNRKKYKPILAVCNSIKPENGELYTDILDRLIEYIIAEANASRQKKL